MELARQLEEVNDSLRILEGNQSEFADAVFKVLQNVESKMTEGFKMMETKITELDAKIRPIASCEVAPCTPSPTSSGKKTGASNDGIFPNASEVSEMCYSVLGKPV